MGIYSLHAGKFPGAQKESWRKNRGKSPGVGGCYSKITQPEIVSTISSSVRSFRPQRKRSTGAASAAFTCYTMYCIIAPPWEQDAYNVSCVLHTYGRRAALLVAVASFAQVHIRCIWVSVAHIQIHNPN